MVKVPVGVEYAPPEPEMRLSAMLPDPFQAAFPDGLRPESLIQLVVIDLPGYLSGGDDHPILISHDTTSSPLGDRFDEEVVDDVPRLLPPLLEVHQEGTDPLV